MQPKNKSIAGKLLVLAALLLFATTGKAQEQEAPKLETDRPDQTQGSSVVPAGTVQIEAGYFYQKDKQDGPVTRIHAYPTALLRVGVLDWLELRAQSALKDSVVEGGNRRRVAGVGALSVGAKVQLWKGQGLRPEAAFVGMVALPVASRVFRPENPEPQLRLAFTNNLSQAIALKYNLAYAWTNGEPVKGYTLSLSGEVSDKLGVYAEVFGNKQRHEEATHQGSAGILFLPLPNLQLDFAVGTRLNRVAPEYFITAGLSLRLPR